MDAHAPLVLFINPPGPRRLYRSMVCTFVSKANYLWQPQDFVTLSAQVPAEYRVQLLDASADGYDRARAVRIAAAAGPRVVIVAISSIVFPDDLGFLAALRQALPEARCLVMGDILLAEHFWPRVLGTGADLILNPMDADIGRYVRSGESDSPHIILHATGTPRAVYAGGKGTPKRLAIGVPRHEAFIDRRYRFPFLKSLRFTTVTTQFGCPYQCNYCSWSKIPVTFRDHADVIPELDYLRSLKIRDFFFGDPSFGFPAENASRLLEEMIRRRYGFRWACYTNPNLCGPGRVSAMAAAGCHTAIIGIEDADFEKLNRQYQRACSRERFFSFVKECRAHRIRVCGDFIIGLNTDEGAVRRMVDFAIALRLDFASFNLCTPLLGSILRDRLIAGGTLGEGDVGYDTSGTFGGHASGGLIRERDGAIRRFYLRPRYLARRLFSITTPAEFIIQLNEMSRLLKNLASRKR